MTAMPLLFATATTTDKPANTMAVARALAPILGRNRALERRTVANTMEMCFGGSDAQGVWDWRDAYDAQEAAQVLHLRRIGAQIARLEDAPAEVIAMLAELSNLTLTHTRRSEEQVELDQFSTPPALAAIAVAAAQIRPGDLVAEPSAGTGLLAVIAEACGASLELNEYADNRSGILDALFPAAKRTRFDALYLRDLIPSAGSFDAVVMNPPFAKLRDHLMAGFSLLAEGGRLSAIVPATVFESDQTMKALASAGHIIAAIRFPDRAFAKHGTSVETGLLVLDRAEGQWDGQVLSAETLAEAATFATSLQARATAKPRQFRQVTAASLLTPRARALATPSNRLAFLASTAPVQYAPVEYTGPGKQVGLFQAYKLSRLQLAKSTPHPSDLVESGPMASIPLPAPTFIPTLPTAIVEKGLISDAQMELVIYAGQAHSRMLPGWWTLAEAAHDLCLAKDDTPGAFQLREGFFLGDGTGCGKGREVAATIMSNMAEGRLRHVWISKNDPLLEDARRDWTALGGSPMDIVPQSRWKQDEGIRLDKGILFTTYATLRQPARDGKPSRLDQIVNWLGADFDGVIAFDEAHSLSNAAGGGEGARGQKKASLQGQAGVALQNRLPSARVLYVSATGATVAENLAYAARLGLWGGPEAPFATRDEFLTAINTGGVSAMELVARELKAMGRYVARSLSFDGVEYVPLQHELTDENTAIWDAWADAFQIIHSNLQAALEATGATDEEGKGPGQHKSAVMSAFESAKQRFFSHLLAGMKAPTIIRHIRDEILPNDKSAVIQIVSTNEAVMERRLATISPDEYDNLSIDMTPKEYVMDYLQRSFPVQAMKEIEDSKGNITLEPLKDDNGVPVLSQEALAMREDLVMRLSCLPAVPGVLDAIIHAFGTDAVAEVTGRSRRVVMRNGLKVLERRPATSAKSETDAFMSGSKRILIFSDAGGTGRSYHADLACANQTQRVHMLVEPGWRADAAVQGLGRTHRTNQALPPLFRPVTTNIQGEKRFLSTIARRLDSLGALTRGERRVAGNGLFSAEDNLESPWARRALISLYNNLHWGSATCMSITEFQAKTGLNLYDSEGSFKKSEDLPPINVFLNRVLALRIADQNAIFGDFQAILDSILESAAERGDLDRGVEELTAQDLKVIEEETVRVDPLSGAETRLVTFEMKTPRMILQADDALEFADRRESTFVVNRRSGAAAVVEKGHTLVDEEDRMFSAVKLFRPTKTERALASAFEESAWEPVDEAEWRKAWQAEVDQLDPFVVRRLALVTGMLLPIWKKLPAEHSLVRRVRAPDGRSWLGRVLDMEAIPALRVALGLTDVATLAADGRDVIRLVLEEGAVISIDGGMNIRASRVMDKPRIEIVNGEKHRHDLKALGAFVEIINYAPRVFVAIDDVETLTAITAKWPASEITHRKAAA